MTSITCWKCNKELKVADIKTKVLIPKELLHHKAATVSGGIWVCNECYLSAASSTSHRPLTPPPPPSPSPPIDSFDSVPIPPPSPPLPLLFRIQHGRDPTYPVTFIVPR
jgi:hypothetical protein